MPKLILDSLEIREFRGFQHLKIEQLSRVNLIVGKNNVGKSNILEALKIYANRGFPTYLWQLLESHDENVGSSRQIFEDALTSIKYLFYGRKDIKMSPTPIQIGPINNPDETLSLNIGYFSPKLGEDGRIIMQPVLFEEYGSVENPIPRFSVQLGQKFNTNYPLDPPSLPPRILRLETREINCVSADADGLGKKEISELWDKIALTDREKEVLSALRIIAPGVEDISLVGAPGSSRERFTIIKVADEHEPLPIRSLGDGMQRMLGISLAIVNAENGILLIDEIENGLHYSVQTDLWRLVFQISQRLNVQVFATSHSWDCIEAFQRASQESKQEEGTLVRLESKKGQVSATVFDQRKLEIATREQIEIR